MTRWWVPWIFLFASYTLDWVLKKMATCKCQTSANIKSSKKSFLSPRTRKWNIFRQWLLYYSQIQQKKKNDPILRPSKAQFIQGKVDKWDSIKIKNFCSAKDPLKRIKRQAIFWEKLFSEHIPNKGLISRISRTLKMQWWKDNLLLENRQKT